ncbi:cytochrome c [Candidatus Persebacteraceae bacterium Df01]|jgi:cytochrome c553|uniref:Cytochrome c n=1 Tax=Candidatus Doriopsillibacter californiensis TaxID=2970740 RepID=A0ABT7QNA1_9GAMM|nr:cytochrome c [Candidatus Persebacteraceae bacterium Df01]
MKIRFFLSLLPIFFVTTAPADQPGDDALAKSNQCVGCHEIPGYRSVFPEIYPVPKIVGQSSEYIQAALQAYKNGERSHPSMNGIAAQLSNDDIKLLADYYANDNKP